MDRIPRRERAHTRLPHGRSPSPPPARPAPARAPRLSSPTAGSCAGSGRPGPACRLPPGSRRVPVPAPLNRRAGRGRQGPDSGRRPSRARPGATHVPVSVRSRHLGEGVRRRALLPGTVADGRTWLSAASAATTPPANGRVPDGHRPPPRRPGRVAGMKRRTFPCPGSPRRSCPSRGAGLRCGRCPHPGHHGLGRTRDRQTGPGGARRDTVHVRRAHTAAPTVPQNSPTDRTPKGSRGRPTARSRRPAGAARHRCSSPRAGRRSRGACPRGSVQREEPAASPDQARYTHEGTGLRGAGHEVAEPLPSVLRRKSSRGSEGSRCCRAGFWCPRCGVPADARRRGGRDLARGHARWAAAQTTVTCVRLPRGV